MLPRSKLSGLAITVMCTSGAGSADCVSASAESAGKLSPGRSYSVIPCI